MYDRLSIYVSSPDSYADIFDIFLRCYKLNWPNSNYELNLSTNSKKYDGIRVINNYKQNDGWVERTISALSKINTKYILLMCDDLFIYKTPDESIIESILDYMDDNNINFCSLNPKIKGKPVNDLLKRVKKRTPYALNLQIGIYNRSFLLNELGAGDLNAWQLEEKWLQQTINYDNCYFDDVISVKKEVIFYHHAIIKGKWFPSVYKKIQEMLKINISTNREILSRKSELFIRIKSFFGRLLSPKKRFIIKKFLKKIGFKFTTNN